MAYEEKTRPAAKPHALGLQDRRRLTVSGVEDVERFDEGTVVLQTSGGALVVRGSALHVDKLSIEGGELTVSGHVDSLAYADGGEGRQGGLFARLFR